MVDEQIIRVNVRAWGCGIKTNASSELSIDNDKPIQGDALDVKMHFEFDPEDKPNKLEITLEAGKQTQKMPYVLQSVVEVSVEEPEFDLELSLQYSMGEPGQYRLEVNFRHAEYGTEIATVQPVIFKLKSPEVEITYCTPTLPRASKGQEVQLQVGLNFPAPQKTRGIIFGRLVSDDGLMNDLYELEPKRISFLGEKEIVWKLRIQPNETNTGTLKGIIEFKSKDAIAKRVFENLIEVRVDKLIKVNQIKSSKDVLSPDDGLVIQAEFENMGLEPCSIEIQPIIKKFSKTTQKGKTSTSDKHEAWSLPPIEKTLNIDEKQTVDIPWFIPKDAKCGYYTINLTWKFKDTKETKTVSHTVFEVRNHHEFTIEDAIVRSGTFQPGSVATTAILITDRGTRAREPVEVVIRIFDILNQEVFVTTEKKGFSERSSELIFIWSIPDGLSPGKYDLTVQVKDEDNIFQKRKFSKFFNIENPVRFELHLKLPGATEAEIEPTLTKFLLENEKVIQKDRHRDLTIYKLNSNSHLFVVDDEPVLYPKTSKGPNQNFKKFLKLYFSYLVNQEYLNERIIDKDLKYWSKLGFCWTNLVLMDRNISKGPGIKQLDDSGRQKIRSSVLSNIARAIFKNAFGQKRPYKVDTSKIFKGQILSNRQISELDEFKKLQIYLKMIIEDEFKFSSDINKKIGLLKSNEKQAFNLIKKMNKLLNLAIKFKPTPNSQQLEKKFSKTLNSWMNDLKRGQVSRKPDNNKFDGLASVYYFVLLCLVSEIESILSRFKKERYVEPSDFINLLMNELMYHYISIMFMKSRAELDGKITSQDLSGLNNDVSSAISDAKKLVNRFWQLNARWQIIYTNYLKNIKNRSKQAFVHDHVKITTNPIIFEGMRGGVGKSRLILGNNGQRSVVLNSKMAFPSNHWSLVEPAAIIKNNLYDLKKIKIPSKQTIEIQCSISFPNTLSFNVYKGILKMKPMEFELLPEFS